MKQYIKYREFTDVLKNFHQQIFLRCQKNVTCGMCTRKKTWLHLGDSKNNIIAPEFQI